MINVTKSNLPPLDEYLEYLSKIWSRNQLTNQGPLVVELQLKLIDYLSSKYLFFVSNGTIAIQIAIKVLALSGDIITTPFSYVATTSSIVWENCNPIFVDIENDSLNIDYRKIEKAITKNTVAILATHVYGNPCNVTEIEKIANKYNLKVIYDAAHSFGVKHKGKHLCNYGHISTLSFHATKLFHTVEGGALVTSDKELSEKISYHMNFGHNGTESFLGLGINGKNSEFHAAMGLCNIKIVDKAIELRRIISDRYDENIMKSSKLVKPTLLPETEYNYSYYPIIFESEEKLLLAMNFLNKNDIFPRRYFYPSLTKLPYINNKFDTSIAESISSRVLCLPIYNDLPLDSVDDICRIINEVLE